MRVRIHRGATEIGGNCVEVQAADVTLLLDLGRPLTATRDEAVPLPDAIGLGQPGPQPLAVILSHGHAD
jgi:ribonuclease J